MSIVACEKCKARYDLPESEVASNGNGAGAPAVCGFCGEALASRPAAQPDLLDELLSMGPAVSTHRRDTARAAPPPPPALELNASSPSVELIEHRGKDSFMGGRQVPLESGLLNVQALEARAVEVESPIVV